jgi:fructokinase
MTTECRFVVCGEALMDVFAGARSDSGIALDARVGGSPFNVAVGLARLGQPVGFAASLSRDFLGERLLQALEAEGVATGLVGRVDAPTTLGLVGMDSLGVPSYSFYGHGGADRQLAEDVVDRLPAATAALHVGSFATVVEPIAGTVRALVAHVQGRALVSYDPNVRLNVEPDLARWRVMLEWMLPRTQLLKISEEDLDLLHPGQAPHVFVDEALAQGVGLAVVTRGAAGAVAGTRAAAVEVPAVAVRTVDTVGAGDTFQAALLTWLAEQQCLAAGALAALDATRLTAAVAFAGRAAALTCSRRGADLPRRHELPN